MNREKFSRLLKTLPTDPGCYLYKNDVGKIIYVGKAKNIKKRVSSYFSKSYKEIHLQALVKDIADIDFVITDSELEAFILETNLIKKYKPHYNRDLKDDKNYIWIMFDKNEDFPKPEIVREKKKNNAIYLGPYHFTMPIKRILFRLRKVYPYRTCNRQIKEVIDEKNGKHLTVSNNPKPCFYYQLGLCPGPCAGLISKKDYWKNIRGIVNFFTKDHKKILSDMRAQMNKYSKNLDYEKATVLRNKIVDLEYIKQKVSIDSVDMDEVLFLKQKVKKSQQGLEELIGELSFKGMRLKKDFKIECFDISNIQGTNAVASMVVFVNGVSQKRLYRKFKIRVKSTPDDFAMMQEALKRRFKHEQKKEDQSFDVKADLVIVDGGKGQLSSAHQIFKELHINIPLIGLAKKNEDIFYIEELGDEINFIQKRLKTRTEGFFLLQRIRDESHRFAINYHRKLRSYDQTASVLDDIPGIGNITKKRLLQAFGSVEGIAKVKDEMLLPIIKNKNTLRNLRKLLSVNS